MKRISQQQRGTALGIFIILCMIGGFILFGFTAFPLYNERMSVQASMESVKNLPPAKRKTAKQIRKFFLRSVQINAVERFDDYNTKDMVIIERDKKSKKVFMTVKYQATNNLFKNIFLMMDVNETLELTGEASE